MPQHTRPIFTGIFGLPCLPLDRFTKNRQLVWQCFLFLARSYRSFSRFCTRSRTGRPKISKHFHTHHHACLTHSQIIGTTTVCIDASKAINTCLGRTTGYAELPSNKIKGVCEQLWHRFGKEWGPGGPDVFDPTCFQQSLQKTKR